MKVWRAAGWLLVALTFACAPAAGPPLYPGNADEILGAAATLPPAASPMPGYLFIAPLKSRFSFLLDEQGTVLHQWESSFFPGAGTELLDDGSILRCGRVADSPALNVGGQGGNVQRIAWDGSILWNYDLATKTRLHHHDAALMPNGNVLLLAWERKSVAEARARGRDPELLSGDAFWPDWIAEVSPLLPNGGEIIWEWHAWDHVIQDFDPRQEAFGAVAAHPELIDVNGDRPRRRQTAADLAAEAEHLAAIGYAGEAPTVDQHGSPAANSSPAEPDWMHANSISYHAGLDLIVISVRRFHEAWVIDHSTTTAVAASHGGGRHGRGGDLIYRWGNPRAYGAGEQTDQRLFFPHHVQWITDGRPGAGNFLCFNNGEGRADGDYSTIEEWRLPIAPNGRIMPGPNEPLWRYVADPKESLYSAFIAGVQRLPNGSTLITEGETGRMLEVSSAGQLLWQWQNTFGGEEGQTARTGRSARVPQKAQFRGFKIPLDHPVAELLK